MVMQSSSLEKGGKYAGHIAHVEVPGGQAPRAWQRPGQAWGLAPYPVPLGRPTRVLGLPGAPHMPPQA